MDQLLYLAFPFLLCRKAEEVVGQIKLDPLRKLYIALLCWNDLLNKQYPDASTVLETLSTYLTTHSGGFPLNT